MTRHQTPGLGVLLEVWGHQTPCDQVFLCLPEQTDVWNTVAGYVLQQLLQCKVGRRRVQLLCLEKCGVPTARGRRLQRLFPSPESWKLTPKVPTEGLTGTTQARYHLW